MIPAVLGAFILTAQAGVVLESQAQAKPPQAKPPQAAPPQAKPPAKTNADAATLADFVKRVEQYVALHKKLEATLPELPKQTNPKEIDQHQRAMSRLIQEARKDAKPGDLFTPAMQRLVRRIFQPIFRGRDGQQIKSEILDNEYKGSVKLVVNGRYPDEVPISTVPPQVLAQLPKLPEELEYRFIRTNLILFDPHAHIIADFVERAFQ
jgi:hypothetical protein